MTPDVRWISRAEALFTAVYGDRRGPAVSRVVMPAVMGDFRKTLLRAEPGRTVTERYRTDDRRTDVVLTGVREVRDGADVCVVRRIEIGGRSADLPGELIL